MRTLFLEAAPSAFLGWAPSLSDPPLAATVADTGNAVTNGTNLQTAINAASPGETIVLQAGAEYRGNFTLPNKSGSTPITIRSTVGLLIGVRVSPMTESSMAAITSITGDPALSLNISAHHWTLTGLEVTTSGAFPNSTRTPGLISQGAGAAYGQWPHDIVIDRCYVHAAEDDPIPYRAAEEGIIVDGERITITNNWVGNFTGWQYPDISSAITAATNASPVQLTLGTSMADPGHPVLIAFTGGTGAWTGLNGVKLATWVDSTHVTCQDFDYATGTLSNTNSTSWGALSGTVLRWHDQAIATSRAILFTVGPGPYTIHNNFLEAYYTPVFSGGGGSWIPTANVVTVSAVNSLTQVVLSGVGDLQVGDLIAMNGTQDQTISNAAPLGGDSTRTNLTVQAHGFPVGTLMYAEGWMRVSGFTGSWTPLNADWGGKGNGLFGRVEDSTHISIPIDSTGFGAMSGSAMQWRSATTPNPTQWQVGHVTNISGTTVTYEWWGHQPDNTNGNGAGLLVSVGATAQFNGTPVDGITVTHNTLSCRRAWIWLYRDRANTADSVGSPPKASWEAKQGNNVIITGNIFQIGGGSPGPISGQAGARSGTVCLALNQASQDGNTPWASLNGWTISNNLFLNYTYQIISMIEEYESGSTGGNLTFTNNLLTSANGSFLSLAGGDVLTVTHNTLRNFGTGSGPSGGYNGFIVVTRSPNTNAIVRDNLGNWNTYGYLDFGSPAWSPTRDHNYLIDNQSQSFTPPTGDVYVASDTAMGFVDVTGADAGGDYHGYALTSGSPGHLAASDSTDVGVNFAALDAALA